MDFDDLLDAIDRALAEEPRLTPCERSALDGGRRWASDSDVVAEITPSGSTGMTLTLWSNGRVIHERIFAKSPMSVGRMARAITEHLTGYAV